MAFKKLKLYFDKELAELLTAKIIPILPSFDGSRFIKNIDHNVAHLELKDRVEIIADELDLALEGYQKPDHNVPFRDKVNILKKIMGPENKEETGMFKNFYWVMPIAKFVEKYGIDDFSVSMSMIEEITKRNTGEYTIRPFIEKYPIKTIKTMTEWSKSEHFHLRRLASEGCRPKLPWATKLSQFIDDPSPILPILENLKNDPKKYVQKSVANSINDILKDNPTIAKQLLTKWNSNPTPERSWIIKHAIRNLIKAADPWAMSIIKKD